LELLGRCTMAQLESGSVSYAYRPFRTRTSRRGNESPGPRQDTAQRDALDAPNLPAKLLAGQGLIKVIQPTKKAR
jgi:hypothetical protein